MRPGGEVVWLMLLALAIRLLAWRLRATVLPDSVGLLGAAEDFQRDGLGALLRTSHHPLAVIAASLVPRGGDPETWTSIGAAVLGTLAIPGLHVVARSAAGRHAATVACLLYAVLPKFVSVSSVPLGEPLLFPLLTSSLAWALVSSSGRTPARRVLRAAWAGALGGLAYLARPEGLVVGVLAAIACYHRGRRTDRRRTGLVAAAAFFLVVAPWIVAMSADRGSLVLSPKKDVAQFAGVDDAPKDAPSDDGATEPVGDPSLRAPPDGERDATAATAAGVRELAAAMWDALGPAIVLAAAGALPWRRWRRRRSARSRAILLLGAAFLCAVIVRLASGWGYAGGRHALSAGLLLLPFAGEGLFVLVGFLSRAVRRRRAALFLTMLIAIPLAVVGILRPDGESGERERILGELIAREAIASGPGSTPDGEVRIATFGEPLVAYYADRVLREHGRRARNLRLFRKHGRLLTVSADMAGQRAVLVDALRSEGASWLVVRLWRTREDNGVTRNPGEELVTSLLADGAIATPVIGSSELAAFPVH